MMSNDTKVDWNTRGKTIWNLVGDLYSFEDQKMPVKMSLDDGETLLPLDLLVDGIVIKGDKTIKELIDYFRMNFKNPNLQVYLLSPVRGNIFPISILGKTGRYCVLRYVGDYDE